MACVWLDGYQKYRYSVLNSMDLSGQFMRKLPANQNQKPVSLEDIFKNRPAVKLTISEEGLESWREAVGKRKKEYVPQNDEELILRNGGVVSYTTQLYCKMSTAHMDYKEYTWKERAVDLAEAYGKLYDEIVQGHKNGEREAYVSDPDAEDGLRRLTLDEELAYLDEAYKSFVDTIESHRIYLKNRPKLELKDMRLSHATGAEREQLLREKEERDYIIKKMAIENTLPEDTREKLLSAAQEFVSRYLNGNGGSISQIVANVQALSEFRR